MAIETAVETVLNQGYRTPDIAEEGTKQVLSTVEMGQRIIDVLEV